MTSTATGCPLEMCRKSAVLFCSWSVSVFPTRHAVLKSTASCSFILDHFHRSTFYRASAVLSLWSSKCFHLYFLIISLPVVRVASAMIQRLGAVMSLRKNSWVGIWCWKFRSVSCSWHPVLLPSPHPSPPLLTLSVLYSEAQQSQPAVPLQTQLKQAALCYRRCCYFRTVSALTPSTQTAQCGDPFSFPSNWWYQPHLNQAEPWPGPDNHRLGLKDDLDVSICLFFSGFPFPPFCSPLWFIFLASVSVSYPDVGALVCSAMRARQERRSNCHQAVWGQRREMAMTPGQGSGKGLEGLFSRWLLHQVC